MKRNNVARMIKGIQSQSSAQGQQCCSKEAQIQQKAYELYEKRGCQPGHEWEDWFEAEKMISR